MRVAVTGLGVVSAVGVTLGEFWQSLSEGRHGFAELRSVDTSGLQFRMGAEIHDLDVDAGFEPAVRGTLDRFAKLWMIAARQAVADSGHEAGGLADAAIVTGSSLGGQTSQDDLFRQLYREGRRRLTPFAVPKIMSNAGASHLSMELGIEGPGLSVSTACASSAHAIGLAASLISQGLCDVAVTGGSDAPFSLGHLKAWDSLRVISPELCRPFSRGRQGMLLAEGAAAMVLESPEAARRRGAPIYAELVGFGMSSDASHLTKPSSKGAARALTKALESAGINADAVEYVNAHGTGTLLNDVTETEAFRIAFRGDADSIPLSSSKSMHGHALGASGAIEAVATVLALRHGVVPPTANYLGPDAGCDLDYVANEARELKLSRALSSSFAFGGLNAALVFGRV